jgi:hypothetical protein
VKLAGTSGCLVLKAPDLRLLAGQFLIPVVLFDGEGVHRYQDFLMPQNLIVRAYTRDIGLFRLDLAFEQRDLAPPSRTGVEPAATNPA